MLLHQWKDKTKLYILCYRRIYFPEVDCFLLGEIICDQLFLVLLGMPSAFVFLCSLYLVPNVLLTCGRSANVNISFCLIVQISHSV